MIKSGQQVIAARSDCVDNRTWKILRRVCTQYTTGIRKPFSILGRICYIAHSSHAVPRPGLNFLDEPGPIPHSWVELGEVTPTAILAVIRLKICTTVMES